MRTSLALLFLVAHGAACGGATAPVATTPTPAPPSAEPVAAAPPPAPAAVEPPAPPPPATPIADAYRDTAARILAAASADDGSWAKLSHLTDRIGNRISGSPALVAAVAWAADTMRADGHENVHTEKVMVPHWVRGAESVELTAPVKRRISALTLGGSVGTPRGGLRREVVVVRSMDELTARGAAVRDKIVLLDLPMPPWTAEDGPRYGATVVIRNTGPAVAGKLGAAAVLVRSVTARSLRTPHTGATRYEEGGPRIPAAAVSTEDADLIARLAASGERVEVSMTLGARILPDAESANVIAELRGREKPDEVVLIGAHLDSWDVGQGAHDDGAGCATVMQALALLRTLGLTPRRTIRVVLFTNEENGLKGAFAYGEQHKGELARHVAVLEVDSGGFRPDGLSVQGNQTAVAQATDLASLLASVGAAKVTAGFSGADLIPLTTAAVPGIGLDVDSSTYFDYHHSEADTLDKVDPQQLRLDVAAVAVIAYVVADMPDRFGGAPAPAPAPAAAP